ncbi:MAG: ROK family protein [Nitrososphaeria archaeon]
MDTAVGIDVGATNIRVAVGVKDGRILSKVVRRTVREGDEYAISRQILDMIKELPREQLENAIGVNIGTVGPLNQRLGSISPTNLPFERSYLVEPISRGLNLPVKMYNDCVAAVIGEKFFGQGREVENLVYITISSGIGGGVFADGRLLLGKDGNAHEIGHLTIDVNGELQCRYGCGKRGHWEAYCSGLNIPNYTRLMAERIERKIVKDSVLYDRLNVLSSKDVFEAAKTGDHFASAVIENVGRLNAIGFANVINSYDPELIVIGGSVALNNKELILKPILEKVGDYAVNRIPEIKFTNLGDEVGLYGAIAAGFYI